MHLFPCPSHSPTVLALFFTHLYLIFSLSYHCCIFELPYPDGGAGMRIQVWDGPALIHPHSLKFYFHRLPLRHSRFARVFFFFKLKNKKYMDMNVWICLRLTGEEWIALMQERKKERERKWFTVYWYWQSGRKENNNKHKGVVYLPTTPLQLYWVDEKDEKLDEVHLFPICTHTRPPTSL